MKWRVLTLWRLGLMAAPALAHEVRLAYLELQEDKLGEFRVQRLPPYAIGSMAMFWVRQRVGAL